MKDMVIEILALIGVATLVGCLACAAMLLFWKLREIIEDKRYDYVISHRFDKDPTAECYCKDCRDWSEERGHCKRFDYPAPDCGFCWRADPLTREERERQEEFRGMEKVEK